MRSVAILAVMALAACSTTGTSVPIGGKTFSPTPIEEVVLLAEPPDRPHEIIALVEGEAATDDYLTKAKTEAAAITAMREEAARIGAHAIVLTGKGTRPYGSVSITNGTATVVTSPGAASGFGSSVSTGLGWEKITFSGTAVRYTD